MKLTYVGPFDEIEVAGHIAKHGETFDVDENVASSLIAQPSNYEPADEAAAAIVDALKPEEVAAHAGEVYEPPAIDEAALKAMNKAELLQAAERLGIDLGAVTNNDDRVAAIWASIESKES